MSTMSMNPGLYALMEQPLTSIGQFFSGPVSKTFLTRDHQDEVVMDVGCGPGNFSTRLILSLFPNVKKIYAVDVQENMIDHAKKFYEHHKVDYSLGDISKWSSVEKWESQISIFFSIHVVHWIKDQKESFKNAYRLLKPGGHAVFFFVLQSTFFDTCLEIKNDIRWSKYLRNADIAVPSSHIDKYEPEYYINILTDLGFSIEYCNSEFKDDIFPSDSAYKDFFISICVALQYIPLEIREQFETDLMDILMKKNGRVRGLPFHRGRMLEMIVRKPEELE